MAENSAMSWTDHTWSPWHGCVKVSALCDNCYALDMDKRFGPSHFGADARRKFTKQGWKDLPKWNAEAKKTGVRKRVFMMSMGDFFEQLPSGHPDRKEMAEKRTEAMCLMESTWTGLDFLVLTKRISNVRGMVPLRWLNGNWPAHIRLGISVGTQKDADRDIPRLLKIDCPNFLSMEPLLEQVDISQYMRWRWHDLRRNCSPSETSAETWGDLYENAGFGAVGDAPYELKGKIGRCDLHWVITGGESGPKARPSHPDWFRRLRDECIAAGVPFHFKQFGNWYPLASADEAGNYPSARLHEFEDGIHAVNIGKERAGHLLDGKAWQEFPEAGQ